MEAMEANSAIITNSHVRKALDRRKIDFQTVLEVEDYEVLRIVKVTRQMPNKTKNNMLLQNLCVLEYIKGALVWYSVHPLIEVDV